LVIAAFSALPVSLAVLIMSVSADDKMKENAEEKM